MNVLLIDAWGIGGITTFYAHLAKYLAGHGITCDAFCYMDVFADEYLLKPHCRRIFKAPVTLTETLSRGDYDVVHLDTCCFNYPLSAHLHIRRARYRGAVVGMAQQPDELQLPEGVIDELVAVSETSAAALRVKNRQQVGIIDNGIDAQIFCPGPPEHTQPRPVLAWVGRADDLAQKDVAGFLCLAAALRGADYDFWLLDGAKKPSLLMDRLADWFGDRVRYVQRLPYDKLPDFYRAVAASGGALVSTSAWEAQAFTVLEAWACGCPTIVPRAKGFEHVERFQAGLIYNRCDALEQIVGSILPMLRDRELRSRLTSRAREVVEQEFTLDRMGGRYLSLYRQVIERRRASNRPVWSDSAFRAFWVSHAHFRRAVAAVRGLV